MKCLLRFCLVNAALLNLIPFPIPAEDTSSAPVVIGYYPSWQGQLPIDKINFHLFTHLIHAFATIQNGTLHVKGDLPSAKLTAAAHAAGVKVLLSLGGEDSGPSLSAMAQDSATEQECIHALAKLIADNGYDGVDIDWEFPTTVDIDNVVTFVTQLKQALRQNNPAALVTMPLPCTNYDGKYFDGPRLAGLIDLALIMTYEDHGPWKIDGHTYSHAGFVSPLTEDTSDTIDGSDYSYQKSIDYWHGKGFTNQQLVVGILFSGHGFMVKKWGDTPLEAPKHSDVAYREVQALLNAGWQRHWDSPAQVPWLSSPPGLPSELISYDDPESVQLKGEWARNTGVRGIFFWEISEDYIDGHNVLVEAGRKGLNQPMP